MYFKIFSISPMQENKCKSIDDSQGFPSAGYAIRNNYYSHRSRNSAISEQLRRSVRRVGINYPSRHERIGVHARFCLHEEIVIKSFPRHYRTTLLCTRAFLLTRFPSSVTAYTRLISSYNTFLMKPHVMTTTIRERESFFFPFVFDLRHFIARVYFWSISLSLSLSFSLSFFSLSLFFSYLFHQLPSSTAQSCHQHTPT